MLQVHEKVPSDSEPACRTQGRKEMK